MERKFYELYWKGKSGKLYSFSCFANSEEDAREQFDMRYNGTKIVCKIKVRDVEDIIVL